jgi:hypothetical protein
MANILVWHGANGEIVAIGRATGKQKVSPVAGQNQFTLEVEIDEAEIKDLHRSHVVDMSTGKLVKHKGQERH